MADMISLASTLLVAVLLLSLFSGCDAGRYCYNDQYCYYGCCGTWSSECCTSSISLIIGLCVGGGVLVFVTLLIICICRRRQYAGTVYRQPGPVVIQQSTVTTNAGVVSTPGVQPGYVYPPYQGGQVAAPYSQVAAPYGQVAAPYGQVAAPYGQVAAPYGHVAAPHGQVAAPYGQVVAPYTPYMAGPPSYNDVTAPPPMAGPTSGGTVNQAFNKN